MLEEHGTSRGWAVVLEEAGYTKDEMEHILEEEDYPQNMLEFRDELRDTPDISAVAATVFRRHRVEDALADRITHVLQNVFDSTYKNTGGLIRFIEESISSGATYDVDTSKRRDTVTAQTIHSAKGLEYPAVFIADINQDRFPSTNTDSPTIHFDETTGLRNTNTYDPDYQFVFDNWKTYLASKVKGTDYSEERRLLYVAMTRAENHLFLSATQGNPSRFFEALDRPVEDVEPEIEDIDPETVEHAELQVDEPETRSAIRRSPSSGADLDAEPVGRGTRFGKKLHAFAERYARGEGAEPDEEIRSDAENVMELIDSLDGELRAEIPIKIPEHGDERKTLYSGKIDLLHITEQKVEIIDWKTDVTKQNYEQHQKQLEIYGRGIRRLFDDKEIEQRIIYTFDQTT